jgi:class 3 adenylate cyclase/pimeloyl-ACP methyl ester carboxylesterase
MERRLAAIMATDVVGYSRLIRADEEGTIAALKALRADLVDPKLAEYNGRIVKLMGDGMLAEFPSVVDAVRAAVETQLAVAGHNSGLPEDKRIEFRVGINLGDVVIEGDDIHGDGVNVAARLEGLAQPGGICVSGSVHEQVRDRIDLAFEDLGEQEVKNISRPVHVYRVEFDGDVCRPETGMPDSLPMQQEIRFCTASDGVGIAYATVGQGFPLVKAANWLNHLEYDWESPIWRHLFRELARNNLLIRYDERGNGLSDWDVDDISFEAFVRDLETVVDATGVERFALLGISQGCAISIAYAVRHPERVTHLVLYGGYARGWGKRGSREQTETRQAMQTLIRQGWGQENPAFRQLFTSRLIPDATTEQMKWFNDLQRITTSPENAARIDQANGEIDVIELLSEVTVPTLVLHCRSDGQVPFDEGRRMAAIIPGARFVSLDGRNHLILEDEPAWPRFLQEVRDFLESGARADARAGG